MKIAKEQKVEQCVSKDERRESLMQCYLKTENTITGKPEIQATDGRKAICLPVELDEGDTEGFVSVESLKMVRKITKRKNDKCTLLSNGNLKAVSNKDGSVIEFNRPEDLPVWPNFEQIFKGSPKGIGFSVAINPSFLMNLAEAFGDKEQITLHFQAEDLENGECENVIEVSHPKSDAKALLMPIFIQ